MTEQETALLLKAGAAAGLDVGVIHQRPHRRCAEGWTPWNPLADDGDALRLSVMLGLQIRHYPIYDTPRFAVLVVDRKWNSDAERDASDDTMMHYDGDPFAATRRAIVRAAAAMADHMTPNDQVERLPAARRR